MRAQHVRRLLLEEWRGLPEPPVGLDRCVPLADALSALIPRLGLTDRLNEEEIRTAWREIVGEFLATHSEPRALRGGILTIGVLQPTVRYELERSWKSRILEKLRERFGAAKIRGIRFQ